MHTVHASGGLSRFLADFSGTVRRQLEARQAERTLMDMSDTMLSDIGISRGDIPGLVRHGRR